MAAVRITEIMYDAPGSDTNREWIELTNEGADALDISGFKLFEANTNHSLTLLSGTGTLPASHSAVIVEDETKFREDNSSFSGTLFKASFSLSNIGETLAIKNSAGDSLDSISYDSSIGAGGDGTTLHRSVSTFIAGTPTPGLFSEDGGAPADNGIGGTETEAPAIQNDSNTPLLSVSGGAPAPQMSIDMGGNRTLEVGAGSFFEAQIYNEEGVPLPNARYIWNFGDGETREGQNVFYAYPYPGSYAVTLSVNAGNGYAATGMITVTTVPAEVALRQESDGSLTVSNITHAKRDMDISLWILSRGGSMFTIPKGTILLAGQAVRFSPDILFLPKGDAVLEYPSGAVAVRADVAPSQAGITYINTTQISKVLTPAPAQVSFSQPTTTASSASLQVAAAADSGASFPMGYSLAGLGALLTLGVAGSLFVRNGKSLIPGNSKTDETDRLAQEFEIVEG